MKINLALCLNLLLNVSAEAQAQPLPPDFTLFGKTAGDYGAEFYQYNYSLSTNYTCLAPPAGPVGDNPVFFLQSASSSCDPSQGVRTFVILENTYVFFPILAIEADNIDTVPGLSVGELRDAAASVMDTITELHMSIDNVTVSNLLAYRASSPVFTVNEQTGDNQLTAIYGHPITGVIDPMIADGYWVMIEPLPVGVHTVRSGGSTGSPFNDHFDFVFNLNIVPVNHPPLADASATSLRFVAATNGNAKVVLDGSRSSDPDNDPLAYTWLEGASVLSMAAVSTTILSVGPHVISLVVSDGKLNATNTITVNVITVEEAVREMALTVQNAGLPRKQTHPLLEPLEDARQSFQRSHLDKGMHELKEFQEEVRRHLGAMNSGLAQGFLQSAQGIIDALSQPPPIPPGVLPNDAMVDGKTIGEWSAEWWKWILPIPIAQNPDLDTNGMFATVGQPDGSVFFVAHDIGIIPGTYTRTFTVPEGKYLFFPLELYEADNVDSVILSVEDLRAQAAAIVDDVKEIHANLDGIDIANLFDHRAISPVFNIFYTNGDNLEAFAFGHPITGLIDPMVTEGYWLMIAPLAVGPHVLHFGGSFSNPTFFKVDVLDFITVVPTPFSERVQALNSSVEASSLTQKPQRELLEELREAASAFERSYLREGIEELGDFQKKVRKEVAPVDPALADQFIQAAQKIIDKAKAQIP